MVTRLCGFGAYGDTPAPLEDVSKDLVHFCCIVWRQGLIRLRLASNSM